MAKKRIVKTASRLPPIPKGLQRGQGISITTIVIAVLALIVLVVLIVIFTGQTGKFTKGVGETQTQTCPGQWLDTCDENAQKPYYGVTDSAELRKYIGKTCCIKK